MKTSAGAALVVMVAMLGGCAQGSSRPAGAPPGSANPAPLPTSAPAASPPRVFETGFESLADFRGMYISPQTATTRHALVPVPHHGGALVHCAWLTGPGTGADADGPNHRGYPTVQLQKLDAGGFATPAVIDLWAWVDATLQPGQWLSLATVSPDASDRWARVVTVNLDPGGWIDVFHVPDQGEHRPTLETHSPFPRRQWVRLTIRIDFDARHGSIEVRQDGTLVATAQVNGGHGRLEQAHFGMYASASLTSARVCNDDLKITSAVR
jgi:hypothetical protein